MKKVYMVLTNNNVSGSVFYKKKEIKMETGNRIENYYLLKLNINWFIQKMIQENLNSIKLTIGGNLQRNNMEIYCSSNQIV